MLPESRKREFNAQCSVSIFFKVVFFVFHFISQEIYRWLIEQPSVKEESLTDWLQYKLSKISKRVYSKSITRREEAHVGADMEWWVLTTEKDVLCAYRFLVQAKHLKTNTDLLPYIMYKNRNGYQIDLLIKAAKSRSAMPLYLYYSCSRPIPQMQIKNFPYINKKIVLWCKDCENGAYLAPAESVKRACFNSSIQNINISDVDLLNGSLGLSMCDLIWNSNHDLFDYKMGPVQPQQISDADRSAKILSSINQFYMSREGHEDDVEWQGIRHTGSAIPEYLYRLINNRGDLQNDWVFAKSAKELESISSITVFDCRAPSKIAGLGGKIDPDISNR